MREYLKARTWPEKIRSIERMNQAARIAREGNSIEIAAFDHEVNRVESGGDSQQGEPIRLGETELPRQGQKRSKYQPYIDYKHDQRCYFERQVEERNTDKYR